MRGTVVQRKTFERYRRPEGRPRQRRRAISPLASSLCVVTRTAQTALTFSKKDITANITFFYGTTTNHNDAPMLHPRPSATARASFTPRSITVRARQRPARGAPRLADRVERTAPPHPERPPRARRDDTAHQSRVRARRRRRPTVRVAAQTRRDASPDADTPPRSPNRTHRHERARPRALDVIPSVQRRSRPHVTTAERARTRSARRNTRRPTRCPDSGGRARESSLRRRRRLRERAHDARLFGFVQHGFHQAAQRGVDDGASRRLTASSSMARAVGQVDAV